MSITFNADEIFEMAEEIERNGAKFYRKAASNASDKEIKQKLLEMAGMEDEHLFTFQKIREQLGNDISEQVFDPDNQAAMYLQAMADSKGCEGMISPGQELTGKESTKEIVEIALNSEKESVVFYFGLKSMVPAEAGREKVEEIIIEELSHVTYLLNMLKNLQ